MESHKQGYFSKGLLFLAIILLLVKPALADQRLGEIFWKGEVVAKFSIFGSGKSDVVFGENGALIDNFYYSHSQIKDELWCLGREKNGFLTNKWFKSRSNAPNCTAILKVFRAQNNIVEIKSGNKTPNFSAQAASNDNNNNHSGNTEIGKFQASKTFSAEGATISFDKTNKLIFVHGKVSGSLKLENSINLEIEEKKQIWAVAEWGNNIRYCDDALTPNGFMETMFGKKDKEAKYVKSKVVSLGGNKGVVLRASIIPKPQLGSEAYLFIRLKSALGGAHFCFRYPAANAQSVLMMADDNLNLANRNNNAPDKNQSKTYRRNASDKEICQKATYESSLGTIWHTQTNLGYVKEAKRRGLNCLTKQRAIQTSSGTNSIGSKIPVEYRCKLSINEQQDYPVELIESWLPNEFLLILHNDNAFVGSPLVDKPLPVKKQNGYYTFHQISKDKQGSFTHFFIFDKKNLGVKAKVQFPNFADIEWVDGSCKNYDRPLKNPWPGWMLRETENKEISVLWTIPTFDAYEQGVRDGDLIKSIQGFSNLGYEEFTGFYYYLQSIQNIRNFKLKVERDNQQISILIPSELEPLLKRLKSYQAEFGFGFNVVELNQTISDYIGSKEKTGLVVVDVVPNSPAWNSGLKINDVITSANGKLVTKIDEIRELVLGNDSQKLTLKGEFSGKQNLTMTSKRVADILLAAENSVKSNSPDEAERLRDELATLKTEQAREQQTVAADNQIPLISASTRNDSETNALVVGTVTDNVEVAELTIDGEPVLFNSNGSFEVSFYVPRNGKTIEIVAFDRRGNSSSKTLKLERGAIQQASGPIFTALNPSTKRVVENPNALALIIGIADYERTDARAAYADKDAQTFYDYARMKLGVPARNIKEFVNDGADEIEVVLAVRDWIARSTKSGQSDVYVFFAGHGLASDNGKQMYLLPYDGSPRLLEESAISRDTLFSDIAFANPRSVTVFLDTCYSGATRGADMLIASRPIAIRAKQSPIPEGFTVFTAAGGDQTAKPLEEAKHGMFSYFLMKGMEGDADANNDNQITAAELHQYVKQNVVQQSAGSQVPELQGDSERVLVRFQ